MQVRHSQTPESGRRAVIGDTDTRLANRVAQLEHAARQAVTLLECGRPSQAAEILRQAVPDCDAPFFPELRLDPTGDGDR